MWHKIDEQEPTIGNHPIWCIDTLTRDEFSERGYYYGGEWWQAGHNVARDFGWVVIAWFDLPPYLENK